MADVPPNDFPRGHFERRPFSPRHECFCGTVSYCQSSGVPCSINAVCGISETKLSDPPASSHRILILGFCERRLAMTQPAEPAPTTI